MQNYFTLQFIELFRIYCSFLCVAFFTFACLYIHDNCISCKNQALKPQIVSTPLHQKPFSVPEKSFLVLKKNYP